MKVRTYRRTVAGIAIAMLLPFSAAHAQLGNLLKGGGSSDGSSSSGLSSLGSMSGMTSGLTGSSLTSGSTSNVAGVLQFCIKNNYLSGNGASSVKDSLMSKLGGRRLRHRIVGIPRGLQGF
jgi:hypothetical protein